MPTRSPDAVDSVRVLSLALLAIGAVLWAVPGTLLTKGMAIEGVFLLGPLLYALVVRLPIVDSFSLRPPRLRVLAYVLGASLGSMWLLHGLTLLQDEFLILVGQEAYARQARDQLTKPVVEILSRGRGTAFLLLSVFPGLCEEFLFRGVVFRGFQRSFSSWRALAYTAILFAAMHQELVKMVPMLFLGFFFGSLVLLSRSLWMGVLAHAANNAAVLVVAELELREVRVSEGAWFLYPAAGLLFASAMACLVREYRSANQLPSSGA